MSVSKIMNIFKKIKAKAKERKIRKKFVTSKIYTKEFLEEVYSKFNSPRTKQEEEAIKRIALEIKTPRDYVDMVKALDRALYRVLYEDAKKSGGLKHDNKRKLFRK